MWCLSLCAILVLRLSLCWLQVLLMLVISLLMRNLSARLVSLVLEDLLNLLMSIFIGHNRCSVAYNRLRL